MLARASCLFLTPMLTPTLKTRCSGDTLLLLVMTGPLTVKLVALSFGLLPLYPTAEVLGLVVRSTLDVRQAEAPENDIELFTMGMRLLPDSWSGASSTRALLQ